MKNARLIILAAFVSLNISYSQGHYKSIKVSDAIEIIQLSDNSFIHTSYFSSPNFGRYTSNGLIYINNGEALLCDTPADDSLTAVLVKWVGVYLKAKVTLFVPNHWHEDCMGGLNYLNSIGVKSYANVITIQIAKSKNLPIPAIGFKDSVRLSLGGINILCGYFGPAHSKDNIAVWIPSEKILFAGCMAKEIKTNNLGNTADGDLRLYPDTIRKVLSRYKEAQIVIPGHGQFGGIELLEHTLELSLKK